MLHGYSQNGKIFYKRMSAIRKACEVHVEFVFLDAPHIIVPADLPGHAQEWLQAAESNASPSEPDDALTPRGWWKADADRTKMTGLHESLTLLRDTLQSTQFHGVLGFSQGAALAGILAAILERPESYSGFIENGHPIHPKLDFFIPVSGFVPVDPILKSIISQTTPKLTTPSLHVVGNNDVIVIPERSQTLIDACDENYARIERHEGGHFVPSKNNWRHFFKQYLCTFSVGVHIPSPSEVSAPSSVH